VLQESLKARYPLTGAPDMTPLPPELPPGAGQAIISPEDDSTASVYLHQPAGVYDGPSYRTVPHVKAEME